MGLIDCALAQGQRLMASCPSSTMAIWPPGANAVASLTAFSCRWPIGEVVSEEFRFCGQLRHRGSYCAEHRRLAYAGVAS